MVLFYVPDEVINIHHATLSPGLLRGEDQHVVVTGFTNFRNGVALILSNHIAVDCVDNAGITAAMTTRDAVFAGHRNFFTFSGEEVLHHDGCIAGVLGADFTLGAHDMDEAAAAVEGIHGESDSDIVFKEHIYGLMVHHIIVTFKDAFAVLIGGDGFQNLFIRGIH